MMTKTKSNKRNAEQTVRYIHRATKRKYSSEEKIQIILEGVRGDDDIEVHFLLDHFIANIKLNALKEH